MDQKMCSRCVKILPLTSFGKNKGRPDGVTVYCRACTRAYYNQRYATDINFRENKKEKTLVHINKARLDPTVKEQHSIATRKWQSNNPGYGRAPQAYAKARKRLKTPTWSEKKEIAKFYRACPAGYEVDHIVPLNGEKYGVCGLHVLANLQYLTVADNAKKKNKWNWEAQS